MRCATRTQVIYVCARYLSHKRKQACLTCIHVVLLAMRRRNHPATKKPQRWNEQLKPVRLQKQLSPPGPQWRENPATVGQSLKQRTEYAGTYCLNSAAKQYQTKPPGGRGRSKQGCTNREVKHDVYSKLQTANRRQLHVTKA